MRVGLGFDVHPVGGEGPLVLGGVTVPDALGLQGHSDGDVVVHAVADALLGAAGLGDLGGLFPDSDDRYRDVDSLELLGEVAQRVADQGWSVANVDVVVAAEKPTLAPYVDAMTERLAAALGSVATDAPVPVSVKPKRGEGVGTVGRSEAIMAWAVTLLVR